MIINLIGCDGCGKSTQVKLLSEYVKNEFGLVAHSISKRDALEKNDRHSGSQYFGVSYRELMWELLPKMVGESRSLFLFNLFAMQLSSYEPERLYILDGAWTKHIATEQLFGIDEKWLKNLAKFFPKIDQTVLIDTEPKEILQRRRAEGYSHAPYECGPSGLVNDKNFLEQMSSLREILLDMANEGGWHVISGDQPVENIHHEITGLLRFDSGEVS